jgi:hypothetical protein
VVCDVQNTISPGSGRRARRRYTDSTTWEADAHD